MNALARQVLRAGYGLEHLGSALRRQASEAAAGGLDVRCDIGGDLDVPASAVEVLSAAAGEALRNAAAHSGAGRAVLTARGSQAGVVTVTIADEGTGFDPARLARRARDCGTASTPGCPTPVAEPRSSPR
jgi:signal transduction histidine kinase